MFTSSIDRLFVSDNITRSGEAKLFLVNSIKFSVEINVFDGWLLIRGGDQHSINKYIYIYTHICVYNIYIYICVHAYTCVCVYIYIYIYIHTYTYVYMLLYTTHKLINVIESSLMLYLAVPRCAASRRPTRRSSRVKSTWIK